MTRGLPLPLRASLNATILLGAELGLGALLGGDFSVVFVLVLLPPSFTGTVVTTWLVGEIEPALPGEGPLPIVLGLLSSWLGAIAGAFALSPIEHLGISTAVGVFACAFGAAVIAALAMRRLTGVWEEDSLVAMLAASIALAAVGAFTPTSVPAVLIGMVVGVLVYQAIVAYAIGLWLERSACRAFPDSSWGLR